MCKEKTFPQQGILLFCESSPSKDGRCEKQQLPSCSLACPSAVCEYRGFQAEQLCFNGKLLLSTEMLHSAVLQGRGRGSVGGGVHSQVGGSVLWAKAGPSQENVFASGFPTAFLMH